MFFDSQNSKYIQSNFLQFVFLLYMRFDFSVFISFRIFCSIFFCKNKSYDFILSICKTNWTIIFFLKNSFLLSITLMLLLIAAACVSSFFFHVYIFKSIVKIRTNYIPKIFIEFNWKSIMAK